MHWMRRSKSARERIDCIPGLGLALGYEDRSTMTRFGMIWRRTLAHASLNNLNHFVELGHAKRD